MTYYQKISKPELIMSNAASLHISAVTVPGIDDYIQGQVSFVIYSAVIGAVDPVESIVTNIIADHSHELNLYS